jgi:hypothetical protein
VSNEWVRHLTGPVHRIANVLLSVALAFQGWTWVTFFIGRIDRSRHHGLVGGYRGSIPIA